MFFHSFSENGPPLVMKIHEDGSVSARKSNPPTTRELFLIRMLESACKKKKFPAMKSGLYNFNITKSSLFRNEMELNLIEE